ncbi:hypothetical protein V1503_20620 [Bacillus sp. SCS-151]
MSVSKEMPVFILVLFILLVIILYSRTNRYSQSAFIPDRFVGGISLMIPV